MTVIVVFTIGVSLGFKLGSNARAKTDAVIYLPLLVRVHQFIESNDMSDAKDHTDMMIIAQVNKYWNLKDTFLFKMFYGKKLQDNELFQTHFKEALAIGKSAATNFVIIDFGATNSVAPKSNSTRQP
jgi:hypothetical protein